FRLLPPGFDRERLGLWISNHRKAARTPPKFSSLLQHDRGGPEAMRLRDLRDKELLALIQGVEKRTDLSIARIRYDRFVRQRCGEVIESLQREFPFLLKLPLGGRHSGLA